MPVKCYNCMHELLDGREEESGDTIFDCLECGGENYALLDEKAGIDHFVITRVKTEHEVKFFLDCPNNDCWSLGYGILPPPVDPEQTTNEAPKIQTGPCPDCGEPRAFFTKDF